mmetsp:Transcript_21559/g.32921  ORF Transcript_21559/g.32921 Transcript_21559/m.32921 type:complete len:258 (+) Transcript_21559:1646-2419(+)
MATLASGRMASAIPITAQILPLMAQKTAVCPNSSSRDISTCTRSERSIPSTFANARFPTATRTFVPPSTVFTTRQLAPFPVTATKLPSIGCESGYFSKYSSHSVIAKSTIARASGCSLFLSRTAINHKISLTCHSSEGKETPRSSPSHFIKVWTLGVPTVTVPVLSKMTCRTPAAHCSAAASFTNTPCDAPTPVPTITAVGTASPSAHGQLITNTLIANRRASSTELDPAISHTTSVNRDTATTAGTNMELILSAND